MAHVLFVKSSPRGARSASNEVAEEFLSAWTERHPDSTIDVLDVWQEDLPPFDGDALAAKYAGLAGEALTPEQDRSWAKVRTLAGRFQAADLLLFAVPMWNYGIPYRLKHLFDLVSQKDLLFTFDERGQNGMLRSKAVVMNARGVALSEAFPREIFDHQTTYMATWLKMVGVEDVHQIEVEKILLGEEAAKDSREKGREAARALATRL